MYQDRRDAQTIRQVSLGLSVQAGELIAAERACEQRRAADLSNMRASMLSSTPQWPHKFHLQASPHPLLIPQKQLDDLEMFHRSLNSAITDIVERWWTDGEAHFPERMPLKPLEEEVLRWMDGQSKALIPKYADCQGSWRPDFLLERNENYRVCEINARFPFNLFLHTAFCQQAYMDMDDKADPITKPVSSPKEICDSLLLLFNPSLPLHLLKGEETGLDIHQFISYVHSRTGRKPSLIKPSDLRLMADNETSTGYALHCATGVDSSGHEVFERVFQVGLELCQHELQALSGTMLREIALCCFNDFRTIFLVHDKRMLGIVLQELDNLVEIQKVLSAQQANMLRQGIVPTMIPGSPEIANLGMLSRRDPEIKIDFIMKPIRGGKGAGIIFGSDMTPTSWNSQLEKIQQPGLLPEGDTYIVQRRINQPKYGMILDNASGLQQNHLVGTYMSIQGHFGGLGPWRISSNRVCALSTGGRWVCSVVPARTKKITKRFEVKARL